MGKHSAFAITMLFGLQARADQPLSEPELLTFCSRSKEYCAVSDPLAELTWIAPRYPSRQSWSIGGWHRWIFVSDAGECAVVGYSGMNLVPMDSTLDLPVLHFHCHGELLRHVRLADLYTSKSQLDPTSSHLSWVNGIHFNAADQLVVHLIDGRRLAFSPKGDPIEHVIEDDS